MPLWVLTPEAAGLEGPDGVSGRAAPPADFGARAAALLCPALPGWEADQAERSAGRAARAAAGRRASRSQRRRTGSVSRP